MKLNQLRVFLEIARTGGVRAAAQHLSLSQSAVTKTLAQLEAEHGVLLFTRTGKGLLLTEAGNKFLPCAESILAGAERAQRILADYGAAKQNTLRLAVAPSVPAEVTAVAFQRFRTRFSDVRVTFTSGLFAEAAPRVLTDQLDLALLIVSDITRTDVAKYSIENAFTIRYGLVMPVGHPALTASSPSSLTNSLWLTTNSPATTARELDTVTSLIGIPRPRHITCCDQPAFETLITHGDTVGLSPLNLLEDVRFKDRLAVFPEAKLPLPLLVGAFVCRRDAELTTPALYMKHALAVSIRDWTRRHPQSALQTAAS